MHRLGEWWRRLWYLLNRRSFEEATRREIEAHRSMMCEPARFGNALRLSEESGAVWGWRRLDALARDLRLACRAIARTPGFALVTIASLALGFALVASTLAIANAYLIRALPYADGDRLYHVSYAPPGPWEPAGMSSVDWTTVADVVEFPVTSVGETFYLTDQGYARSARSLRAARGFVDGLPVRASLGRSLAASDFDASAAPVALIGDGLWRDRYGADPAILGRTLRAEAETRNAAVETFTVVGVLPPDFYFGRDSAQKVDVLVPLTTRARTYMVRLREGVKVALAEQRITAAARTVATDLPAEWSGVRLTSVRERYVADLRPILRGFSAASGLVLLIVCANVAVLLLLRTMRRQKEMAVRAALGAGRWQLGRLVAAETSLLCAIAIAFAAFLTGVVLRGLAPQIETQFGRQAPGGTAAIALDGTVMIALGAIGVVVALSLSFLPLLAPWQRRLAEGMRHDARTATDGRPMRRLRSGLIAVEVAGTLMLVVSCGLVIRNVIGMLNTDLGFEAKGLVRAGVVLRGADYPEGSFLRFYEPFMARVSNVAGSPVVLTNWPPFSEVPRQLVELEEGGRSVSAGSIAVGAAYFATLGIPVREGRDLTPSDVFGGEPVAVISETLARRLWPEGGGVGRVVRGVEQTAGGSRPGPWRTVVGVAADVRQMHDDRDQNDFYVPWAATAFGRFGSFYIRTDRPLPLLLTDLRTIAASLDPHAIVNPPRAVETADLQLAGARFLTTLLVAFALGSVFLAILSISGVTAYAVRQREREVAIRMALGAREGAVVGLFVKEGALVLAVGVAAGLVGARAGTKLLESYLYAVEPFDLLTLAAACAFVAGVGGIALWWPARRAALQRPGLILKEG